jgi:hypothetical protein
MASGRVGSDNGEDIAALSRGSAAPASGGGGGRGDCECIGVPFRLVSWLDGLGGRVGGGRPSIAAADSWMERGGPIKR